MTQSFVTVAVPISEDKEAAVNTLLDSLGNVAGKGACASPPRTEALTEQQLDQLRGFVHFLSIVVAPADGAPCSHLIIELCADGEPGAALELLVRALPIELLAIFAAAGKADTHGGSGQLLQLLNAHRLDLGTGVFAQTLGLAFAGTPGMTVRRILDEDRLATRVRALLRDVAGPKSAYKYLEQVRARVFEDADLKWAFVSEPVPLLAPAQPRFDLAKSLVAAAWRDFLWPLIPPPLVASAAAFALGKPWDLALWWMTFALAIELVVVGLALKIGYERLRRLEEEDVPFDIEPDAGMMKKILERENQPGVVQNHLFAVSRVKPGRIRRTAIRGALWSIGELQRGLSRPGFLNKIGTIHFARWVLLPRTDQLLFFSNYDGSWQSYLEDFIARLREGLTSIWSNTRDFPKTSNLVAGGVADGARFKRWARRQQLPTRFWYASYPHLTADQIRTNAAIRHGFAAASNEAAAAKWLALFDYAEPETVEKDEVCSLAFGGLSGFEHAHCLIVHFHDRTNARAWLRTVAPRLAYGEHSQLELRTLVVALTRTGLETLGLDAEAIATFPTAFQQGMSGQRSRALGDGDTSGWSWGGVAGPSTDAALLIYSKCADDLETQKRSQKDSIEKQFGHRLLNEVTLKKLDRANPVEPFGFRDGISQPIMRGSKRWSETDYAMHVVEPGELVLGYRDNLGNVVPTPHSHGRDIGRNGTFMVIRQLEQDKAAFDQYVDYQANRLQDDPALPSYSLAELRHWVAAHMVGRWKDGSSLVRNLHPPAQAASVEELTADNTFQFGREDPDGLRCPLGSHIRRANPRESFDPGSETQIAISNRHRILRVGRVYQPDSKTPKPGLLFMCINADIERQFEFIQQTWLLGPNFHDLDNEADPIVGSDGTGSFTVRTNTGPVRMSAISRFVTTRGGAYFFVPGRSVLPLLTG